MKILGHSCRSRIDDHLEIVSRSFATRAISTTVPAGSRLYSQLCVVVSSLPPLASNFSARATRATEKRRMLNFSRGPRPGNSVEAFPGRLRGDAWMKAGGAICIRSIRGWRGCREKERGASGRRSPRVCVFLRFKVSQRERNAGYLGSANVIPGITSSQFVLCARAGVNFVCQKARHGPIRGQGGGGRDVGRRAIQTKLRICIAKLVVNAVV